MDPAEVLRMEAVQQAPAGLAGERNLRPNRRTSYKSFFRVPEPAPAEDGEGGAEVLPTPVSMEDTLCKGGALLGTNVDSRRRGTLITPQSLPDGSSAISNKRRKLSDVVSAAPALAPARRQNPVRTTKTYLESLERRIKAQSMTSSWLQRKDRFIHQPVPELDGLYVRFLVQQRSLENGGARTFKPNGRIVALLEAGKRYAAPSSQIRAAQRGRAVERREIIDRVVLPIVNAYGMHHETLYIAVNLLDRFLAQAFVHRKAMYHLAGAACAFIAVKYNEEFDPECSQILSHGPLKQFGKRDLLAMERRVMQTLAWDLRPLTPHVLAYKVLDELHGFFPLGFKRYLVNIVERVVLSAYCSPECFEGDWDLRAYTLGVLAYAYECALPEMAPYIIPGLSLVTGGDGRLERTARLSSAVCQHFAYLPVVYGHAIQLPKLSAM